MGDFNSVMNNNEDIISGNKHNIKEVQTLNQLVVNIDARDIWKLQNKEEREYTWNRSHPFTARRIDYYIRDITTSTLCRKFKNYIVRPLKLQGSRKHI